MREVVYTRDDLRWRKYIPACPVCGEPPVIERKPVVGYVVLCPDHRDVRQFEATDCARALQDWCESVLRLLHTH